jgi:hypothetical protein
MDPEETKIPVPMRDAQRIYAALGSLRRIAAIEANDEFVETLDGLMARLKDSHNAAVVAARGAGRDEELIEGSEEDRRAPPSQEPQHYDSSMPHEDDRAELLNRLYGAQTELPEGRIKRPSKRVAIFRAPGKLQPISKLSLRGSGQIGFCCAYREAKLSSP